MTVTVMSMVLVPIVWASGTGSDVMQRIAAPMIGGIFTAFLMEFLIYPVVFELGKTRELRA
jgi:Cu(I)/Ag(I) efflux system membrane protein CusA/SilA